MEIGRGVYDTRRAAALAGVPLSTIHYWARTGLIKPSVCPEPRVRLWSWADLLALRAIDFFRKTRGIGKASVSIRKIRDAIGQLERRGCTTEQLSQMLAVSRDGELFLLLGEDAVRADRGAQAAMPGVLALVRPYGKGPDLLQPRPRLRIIPGKLHGEPHLLNTRIPSAAVYALRRAGYETADIVRLYPEASAEGIREAIELEQSLEHAA